MSEGGGWLVARTNVILMSILFSVGGAACFHERMSELGEVSARRRAGEKLLDLRPARHGATTSPG